MNGLWVFGYGSLVWRPAFSFDDKHVGWIRGWTRRFWQGSTDHRGTPDAPGRVVTLHADADARCDGVVYRVADAHVDAVLRGLDHREKGGYERHRVTVHRTDAPDIEDVLVYVAGPTNDDYVGPAPLAVIAEHVRRCVGPSGRNDEYVLRLADALRKMGAQDEHVFALEALIRSGNRRTGRDGS